jgi:hypothetical protein
MTAGRHKYFNTVTPMPVTVAIQPVLAGKGALRGHEKGRGLHRAP